MPGEVAPDEDPSTDELVQRFMDKDPMPHERGVVYGIFDDRTGECLYVGEAKWLISRLNDHYNTRTGSQIKAFVEDDDAIDIDATNVWERTAIKYVEGLGDARYEVEQRLIERLTPRYNTRYNG